MQSESSSSSGSSTSSPFHFVVSPINGQSCDWHISFQLPAKNTFSWSVQKAIDTGVISSKARREIVQVLRTLISRYTKYPTSDQYTIICQKLVEKFPHLQDSVGSNRFVRITYGGHYS